MLEGDLLAVPQAEDGPDRDRGPSFPASSQVIATNYVNDKPVETADIIVPADRYSVYYRIPIPDR